MSSVEIMAFHNSSVGCRFCLGMFLMNMATNVPGLNLRCTNDFVISMLCRFGPPPNGSDCAEYHLNTKVHDSTRPTESCNLTRDPDQTGRCSCSLDMAGGFLSSDIHNTKLWKAGDIVESKNISVLKNIKPKAPHLTSVARDPDNGNYIVEWETGFERNDFNHTVEVSYRRRGDRKDTILALGQKTIPGESLEPSTEYLVSLRSHVSFYSDRSNERSFTTPMSSSALWGAIILSLCVTSLVIAGSLFVFFTRFKERQLDTISRYKNSTLFDMVPGEQKVLAPQDIPLCSVSVQSRKEDRDGKPCSSDEYFHGSPGADQASTSLGDSPKNSVDIISNVENAMRLAFPQIGPPPPTAPSLFTDFSNPGYQGVTPSSVEYLPND